MKQKSLKIVADAHIWGVTSAFSMLPGFDVELRVLEAAHIAGDALKDADILLTRSSTQVNEKLLADTPVRFAATATIGDDHYDKLWLQDHGIVWANAAGSSTSSVIEYMIAALLELHHQELIALPDVSLGIVGVGRIGQALANVCDCLQIKTLLNDPPRERAEQGRYFSSLARLLAEADVITLHTPLVREGVDKTYHLIDGDFLSAFKGRGIINAARGECADNAALLAWLDVDTDRFVVMDCWEGEPLICKELLSHPQTVIATPHIAGHSLDGRAANTQYIYHALCHFLGIRPLWDMDNELPATEPLTVKLSGMDPWQHLHTLAHSLYPIMRDHMRSWSDLSDDGLSKSFAHYRRHYPVRRGWHRSSVALSSEVRLQPMLTALARQMEIELTGLKS